MDGTLIGSHASIKSFKPKQEAGKQDGEDGHGDNNGFKSRNAEVDFHGKKRSNDTHASTTDPEARLYKKGDGQAAKLYHTGHAVAENRNGLVMAVDVTEAAGDVEPAAAALSMLDAMGEQFGVRPKTLGTDKGYDGGPFLLELEGRRVRPHVPTKDGPIGGAFAHKRKDQDAIEARRRMRRRERTAGYKISQRCRKKVEEVFGWLKTVAGLCRTKLVGRWKIKQQVQLAAAAYNLLRIRKLAAS